MRPTAGVGDSSLLEWRRGLPGFWRPLAGIAGLVAMWSLASWTISHKAILPSPIETAIALGRIVADGTLPKDVYESLLRVLAGFGIGAIAALVLGIGLGLSRRLERALEPVVELLRAIPPYAMIPFAILAFGIGAGGKLFILAFASFFPVLVNTVSGVAQVPGRLIDAARTLGASRRYIIVHVVLPAAAPHIALGMRVGLGAAWLSLIAAEMVASPDGLGFLIADAREMIDTPVVLSGMLVIGVLGYALNRLFLLAEHWLGIRR